VLVRDGAIIGAGYHHRAGAAHAETEALHSAGDARGATLYVSLEPCNHAGKTPPCTQALIAAGVARVVIGAADPNPRTGGAGIAALSAAGLTVELADTPEAHQLIEPFAAAMRVPARPYVAVKIASSEDGFVASHSGESRWLTGDEARTFVRELRIAHDAVLVGAGTIRVDDPLLTVRPAHDRLRPYQRVVACETEAVAATARIFAPQPNYRRTVVLAPAARRKSFRSLEKVADVLYVGAEHDMQLDLEQALRCLCERGIQSVLCEGGPTLAGRMLESRCADRVYWLSALIKLAALTAVPALVVRANGALPSIDFDRVERLGKDMVATGEVSGV